MNVAAELVRTPAWKMEQGLYKLGTFYVRMLVWIWSGAVYGPFVLGMIGR